MRAVIACGGTGGHFYPGYALARALRERGHEVVFIVRKDDPACARLEREDLPFAELDLRGMPRRVSMEWPGFLLRLLGSFRTAWHVLRSFNPDAAVAMGAYISFPVTAAARLRGVPYVLHEANSVLGLANRLGRGGAAALALGLPLRDGGDGVPTGTPIRRELWEPAGDSEKRESRAGFGLEPGKRTLLVFGGSQGARALNEALPEALRLLPKEGEAPQVLHLSGPREEGSVREAYAAIDGLKAEVRGYVDGMRPAYAAADLVVSRAGASTISELYALRVPALLVPFPSATGGHQEANGRVLERTGAGKVLLERDLTPESLASVLQDLLRADRLGSMSRAYSGLGLPPPSQAGEKLADLVERCAGT